MHLACLMLPFALAQAAPAQPAPAQAAPAQAAPAAAAPAAPAARANVRILGRDDLGFARQLVDKGFYDLARGVCVAVEASAKTGGKFTPDDVLEATILGFEAETGEAGDIGDLAVRKDRLAEILTRAEVFAKTLPDGPKSDRLNQALAAAQQSYAETLLALMQEQDDPTIKGKTTKEADAIFTKAEEGLAKKIELTSSMRVNAKDEDELAAIDRKLILDQYSLARMYYLHSLLLEGNEVKRRVTLHQALEAFSNFELDWGTELLAYDAYIYDGLCQQELGEDDKAIESFDYAIALRETYGELRPDGTYPVSPEAADIVSLAVQRKMLFYRDKKDWPSLIGTAHDFLKTIPDALQTQYGLQILGGLGDAQLAAGDGPAALETANRLIAADPQGPWGRKGNNLLTDAAKSGPVDSAHPEQQLRIAETFSDKRDFKAAHAACYQARVISEGSPVEADIGAESFVIDGIAFGRDGRKAEACIAFDSAVALYPKGAKAPDALWRSINTYLELYDDERRAFYKKATDERMAQFVKDYPKDPNVTRVSFIRGKQLETEKAYDQASQIYLAVPKDSPAFGEAQFRAGNCLMKQAKDLEDQNKFTEATACRKKAQPILENAQAVLEKQMGETLNEAEHSRLASVAFGCRVALAQAWLTKEDAGKVRKLFENVEETYAGDADKIAMAWTLRIKALEIEGKLQDAVTQLDNLISKTPDAPAIGNSAGSLARALDRAAEDLLKADPASRKADPLRHDAARFYVISVRGQVSGKETLNATSLEAVGQRLYSLALHFEGAPEGSDSFLDWQSPRLAEAGLWDQIGDIFSSLTNTAANSRAYLFLGRVRGFQSQWKEGATAYSKLFSMEQLVPPGADKRFDSAKRGAMPWLVNAYVEWGMCELLAGKESGEKDRLARAGDIFDRSLSANNLEAGSMLWWRAKTMQVETMVARGQYEGADITLRDLERTTQDYDQNKYGAKAKLLALKAEVAKRVGGNKVVVPKADAPK